jgi:imidazolonepropionase-like amidohydrolase
MDRTVLTGATLIDGSGAPPVAGRAVIVERGRITAVVAEREAPAGTTIRLDGLTLLPGLINCHVHFCFGGEPDPAVAMQRDSFATTVIKAVLRARQTVAAGVTTVRDLGGRDYAELSVRDAVRAGLIPGPRVLAAGAGSASPADTAGISSGARPTAPTTSAGRSASRSRLAPTS